VRKKKLALLTRDGWCKRFGAEGKKKGESAVDPGVLGGAGAGDVLVGERSKSVLGRLS